MGDGPLAVNATLKGLPDDLIAFRDRVRGARDGLPESETRDVLDCALLDHVMPLLAMLREEGWRAALAIGEGFAIRRADEKDAERVERWARALDGPGGPPLPGGLDLADPGGRALVLVAADPGQELVGLFRATAGEAACITHLAVLPAFGERGLAARLLLLGIADLVREGVRRIGGFVEASGALEPLLAAIGAEVSGKLAWMEREVTPEDRQDLEAGRVGKEGSAEALRWALGDALDLAAVFAEPGRSEG